MKIKEIIEEIKKEANWVNYSLTRDVILANPQDDLDVDRIGVCWVATYKVLQEAARQGIHFIIGHENFLYVEGTAIYRGYLEDREKKRQLCLQHGITVYRLHDGWDQFPQYGVCDQLGKVLGFPFAPRPVKEFHQYADLQPEMTVKEVAHQIATSLAPYGADYVEVLGDTEKTVHRLAIGVGAISRVPEMNDKGADCFVLADDGCSNWIEQQWCLDNDIPVILFHHSVNEMPGIDGMAQYITDRFPGITPVRLHEGFRYTCIK
ncbi:MAG: Nif3-like dinuclear metal center hexameric protein [Erysipelotrichaceae bacterium]|nr:Nif3-like dinuclear metal center hexameric protein [Erysipelotrichaceae bacterium]